MSSYVRFCISGKGIGKAQGSPKISFLFTPDLRFAICFHLSNNYDQHCQANTTKLNGSKKKFSHF